MDVGVDLQVPTPGARKLILSSIRFVEKLNVKGDIDGTLMVTHLSPEPLCSCHKFMPSYSRRWLRPLLAFVLSLSLLISYIYLKSRPSYELYKSLSENEFEQSRKLVQNSRENKYVLFKQLQGAGFNNQVG